MSSSRPGSASNVRRSISAGSLNGSRKAAVPTVGRKGGKKKKSALSVDTGGRRGSSGLTAMAQMKLNKQSPANKAKNPPTKAPQLQRTSTVPTTKKEKKHLSGRSWLRKSPVRGGRGGLKRDSGAISRPQAGLRSCSCCLFISPNTK